MRGVEWELRDLERREMDIVEAPPTESIADSIFRFLLALAGLCECV